MCGAGTPAGQECNSVKATGAPVTPACVSGTLPAGQGGTIVDGTYVLTAQTYYNPTNCPTLALSETLLFGGGCLDVATGTPFPATASGTFTVSGARLMLTRTCIHIDIDGATTTPDMAMNTFTATPTTFTIFGRNSPDGGAPQDTVTVFTRQ
jgi:hypothetical protein